MNGFVSAGLMMPIRPRRCLLFVPGARAERFAKAMLAGADQVCIDLEDAVGLADKETAREATLDFIEHADASGCELGLRINLISSALGVADLKRLVERKIKPAFVMLPKIESVEEVLLADKLLAGTAIPLIALLESPHAVFEARAIAQSTKGSHSANSAHGSHGSQGSKRLQAIMFGGFDYAVAARVKPGNAGWAWARGQIAAAAAEAEIGAIDVPSLETKDVSAIGGEAEHVMAMGFTAKAAIHPAQVLPIQNAFLPTPDEVSYAERILNAVANANNAAIAVDGKLVDRPIELAAQRIAEMAKLGVRVVV